MSIRKNTAAYASALFCGVALLSIITAACKGVPKNDTVEAIASDIAVFNSVPINNDYVRIINDIMPIIEGKESIFFVVKDDTASMTIDEDKLIFRRYRNAPREINKTREYNVELETVHNMVYVNFYDSKFDSKLLKNRAAHGQERYLVLGYEPKLYRQLYWDTDFGAIFLYDENNKCVFELFGGFSLRSEVTVTSELIDGETAYGVKNVMNADFLQPWAEGKPGSGIDEKITFIGNETPSMREIDAYRYYGICISNGYVDYNKPYLYEYNNRVKKIRVSCGNPDDYVDFELEDTPQLQFFYFWNEINRETGTMAIEILEVYKGSRHDNTCINFIIPLGYNIYDR